MYLDSKGATGRLVRRSEMSFRAVVPSIMPIAKRNEKGPHFRSDGRPPNLRRSPPPPQRKSFSARVGVPLLRRQANIQRHALATPRTMPLAACDWDSTSLRHVTARAEAWDSGNIYGGQCDVPFLRVQPARASGLTQGYGGRVGVASASRGRAGQARCTHRCPDGGRGGALGLFTNPRPQAPHGANVAARAGCRGPGLPWARRACPGAAEARPGASLPERNPRHNQLYG